MGRGRPTASKWMSASWRVTAGGSRPAPTACARCCATRGLACRRGTVVEGGRRVPAGVGDGARLAESAVVAWSAALSAGPGNPQARHTPAAAPAWRAKQFEDKRALPRSSCGWWPIRRSAARLSHHRPPVAGAGRRPRPSPGSAVAGMAVINVAWEPEPTGVRCGVDDLCRKPHRGCSGPRHRCCWLGGGQQAGGGAHRASPDSSTRVNSRRSPFGGGHRGRGLVGAVGAPTLLAGSRSTQALIATK